MDEISVLATLIQHADQQIDTSMNMFLVLMGIMATFTMTDAYEKKFNAFLKVLLSIGLTMVFWANREAILDQMYIYNALIESFPDDIEPWKTLFGDHTVYHKLGTTGFYWFHASASTLVHVLVWHKELNITIGRRMMVWWKNQKTRRRD